MSVARRCASARELVISTVPGGQLAKDTFAPLLPVVVAFGGFFAGWFFVLGGGWPEIPILLGSNDLARQHAAVLIWFLLIGAEGALWALSILLIVSWIRRALHDLRVPLADLFWGWIAPTLAVVGTAYVVFNMSAADPTVSFPLDAAARWPPDQVGVLETPWLSAFGMLGILVAAASSSGLFLVAITASRLREYKGVSQRVESFLQLRSLQDRFLGLTAVIFGLGILSTAALAEAHNAGRDAPFFYRGYLIAYGGFFSLGLAIIFSVSRLPLQRVGSELRDDILGCFPSEPSPASVSAWIETFIATDKLLRLRIFAVGSAGEALSIATPLFVSLLSLTAPTTTA